VVVKEAKAVARQWVMEEASKTPGFTGAYYAGSIAWLPDDVTLPPSSDLDVMVVLADPNPADKLGKFVYQGALLEVTYLPGNLFQTPDRILGDYHLAASFSRPGIILDPSGRLAQLQTAVSRDYAKRRWVRKRCAQARDNVLGRIETLNASAPFHDQVTAWLFGTGVTTHVLLVAGLKNPTVRRRYVAARELLAEFGQLDFYETLLALLGCAQMSRTCVGQHLVALAAVFDVAKTVIRTPYRFAADISDIARPVAIDGSREMIESGFHREAIFWMVATYSRCQHVLYQDAPLEVQERFSIGYRQILGDLGIISFADLAQRCAQVKAFLPRVWEMAETIMAANPGIED
jgi:hypothetical protein